MQRNKSKPVNTVGYTINIFPLHEPTLSKSVRGYSPICLSGTNSLPSSERSISLELAINSKRSDVAVDYQSAWWHAEIITFPINTIVLSAFLFFLALFNGLVSIRSKSDWIYYWFFFFGGILTKSVSKNC